MTKVIEKRKSHNICLLKFSFPAQPGLKQKSEPVKPDPFSFSPMSWFEAIYLLNSQHII